MWRLHYKIIMKEFDIDAIRNEKFIKTVRRDVVTRRTCNCRMKNLNIRGMVQKRCLIEEKYGGYK